MIIVENEQYPETLNADIYYNCHFTDPGGGVGKACSSFINCTFDRLDGLIYQYPGIQAQLLFELGHYRVAWALQALLPSDVRVDELYDYNIVSADEIKAAEKALEDLLDENV